MSEPFLGEIKLFSFDFPPKGWAFCNGQLLPINQNQALYALLGTTYGGNGQTTFALPELRGKCVLHTGNIGLGTAGGSESVTLTQQQLPTHTHGVLASTDVGNTPNVSGSFLAGFNEGYRTPTALTTLRPSTVTNVGGSQPHENMSPYLVLNFCIALQGIFPSRN